MTEEPPSPQDPMMLCHLREPDRAFDSSLCSLYDSQRNMEGSAAETEHVRGLGSKNKLGQIIH